MNRFVGEVKAGLKYGSYMLGVCFLMGLVYGLFAGLPFETASVSVIMIGLLATLNFVLVILLLIPWLISLIFKQMRGLTRYMGLSVGFVIVFGFYFLLLKFV